MPSNGDVYVSDGYGNSRIHVYHRLRRVQVLLGRALALTPASSSGPTTSPLTATTGSTWWTGKLTASRFSTPKATSITMWNNIHRPGLHGALWQDHIYVGELNGMAGVDEAPGLGPPCHDL